MESKQTPEIKGQLTPDPRNPGWVKGWGVFRSTPWHLYGVYASDATAATIQQKLGDSYSTAFGSHCVDTDDFVTASSDTRWIKAPLSPDHLADKKVFARFVTRDGGQYEGTGQLRVRQRPSVDDLIAVDLAFTRKDSSTQFTDIVFFLTASQVSRLKRTTGGTDYDFEYTGLLSPAVAFALEVPVQQKLNRIDELSREIDSLKPFDSATEVRVERKLRIDWNYNSNAIEGNQVSRGETELFLEHGLTAKGKPFKDYLDIKGHDQAVGFLKDLIERKEPLTEAVLRELHRILLIEPYEVPAETPEGQRTKKVVRLGEYKRLPNHVRTTEGSIHHYASPEETPARMGDLMQWYRQRMEGATLHPVIIASLFHHQFTAIHPFDDGNGRMARLLTNLILMQHHLPPAVFRVEKRSEYLFALREADAGKHDEIINQHATEVIRSLETMLRGARGEPVEEPDDIDKEITLLRQQLQHLEEPEELSLAVQERLFNETINPFLRRFGQKLSQLETFYSTSAVSMQGTYKLDSSNAGWSAIPGVTLRNLAESILIVRGSLPGKLINHIQVSFTWSDLKKLPLTTVQDSMELAIQFDKLNYTVSVRSVPITIKHVYNAPLEEREVNDFIRATCRKLMTTIQQAVKTQLEQ
ncbi:MAG: Fic family protein [Chthoniobacterales bacterium]